MVKKQFFWYIFLVFNIYMTQKTEKRLHQKSIFFNIFKKK